MFKRVKVARVQIPLDREGCETVTAELADMQTGRA